jgi:CSLREA domain-containing protein
MISGCWRFVAVAGTALLLSSASGAATFVVDTFPDEVDAAPGDGVCATALGGCTLRAAIMEANALLGPDTVLIPAGTFPIERPWPLAEDEGALGAAGDLDIWDDLTLVGAGSSETEIGPGTSDHYERILNVHAGVVVDKATLLL